MSAEAEGPPLRLALVIEDVGLTGGQERVIAELAPRLARHHDLHLFCFTARDMDLSNITLHRLRPPPLPPGPRAIWFTLASSLRIRPGQFDIVLSQGGNTLAQNATLVHTMHRRKHDARVRLDRRFGLKPPWRRAWEGMRDRIFAHLERRAVRRCQGRIIAVSRTVRDYLVEQYGLRADDVHVAHNGVDHSVFRPDLRPEVTGRIRAELGLEPDEFVALFMGGRWYEKGLPELLQALALIERPLRLVVVGRGDVERFSGMATDLAVIDRVRFVPHVDRPQDYFAMADCLVHPNPIEPFGLVLLEAASCGLPLLAARSGVAIELVKDGVTGFFIEREPRSIATGLERLIADPSPVDAMRESVHERSLAFSWDEQARRIDGLLRQFVEEADGERA